MFANILPDSDPLVNMGILLLTILAGWMGREEWRKRKDITQSPDEIVRAIAHLRRELGELSETVSGVHKGWNARRETEKLSDAIHEVDLIVRDIKTIVNRM